MPGPVHARGSGRAVRDGSRLTLTDEWMEVAYPMGYPMPKKLMTPERRRAASGIAATLS